MERKMGWLAFPGLLRFYAMLHLGVFVLQFFRPGLWQALDFDRDAILAGQVWRAVTFLFSTSGVLGSSPLTIVFFIFGMFLMFTISDALEGAWGVFRTSVFYYVGWITLVVANFIFGGVPLSGFTFYASVFFAFATLFPKFQLSLFLIIPVPVVILALIQAGFMLLSVIRIPALAIFYSIALLNYLLWCAIPALKGQKMAAASLHRRRSFNAKKLPKEEAFHVCVTCERTEVSDPSLDFRIGTDGQEYCEDHLPK